MARLINKEYSTFSGIFGSGRQRIVIAVRTLPVDGPALKNILLIIQIERDVFLDNY